MQKHILYRIIPLLLLLPVIAGSGCSEKGEKTARTDAPDANATLTLYGVDPHTLDPAISGDSTSHQYVTQIFSGLFRLDDDLSIQPDIVETWDVDPEGTTYTFHLRENATFQDGTPVTADDFKYSWERACDPETGSNSAGTYLGDIVGADDVLSGLTADISGVRVKNDHTLEVKIDSPRSYFLYKLSYPTTFVVDEKNVSSGENWWNEPNGTGPFTLAEWTESERLVLEWNERYYGTTPGLYSVTFLLWGGVPMIMYETGEIDVTGVPVSYMERVTDPSESFYDELAYFPELSFYYFGFNTQEPPFDDINVRMAFSMAIDRERIADLIYKGTVEPATGILPPGIPGYNGELEGYGFNPEKARQLIAESSYGSVENLPKITLTTPGYGAAISIDLEAVIEQWKTNLGVEIEVRQLEPNWYFYNLIEEKDQIFDIGWIADYPHPENFLTVLFGSNSGNNYGEYSNPEVDSLLDRASRELDTETSMALYREAEEVLVEDAACIPLYFGENYYLIKPHVKGFYLNPLGIVMLDEVRIDYAD